MSLPRRHRRRERQNEIQLASAANSDFNGEGEPARLSRAARRAIADRTAANGNQRVRELLREAIEKNELGMVPPHDPGSPNDRRIFELRRGPPGEVLDTVGTLALVEDDGVLRWEPHSAVSSLAAGRRRSSRTARRGVVVDLFRFEALESSQIGRYLESIDDKLTPHRGLRELGPDYKLRTAPSPRDGEAILLLVHGTFSNCDHLVAELLSGPKGQQFLAQARTVYDRVLTFDHATLSVSPVMNAVDLARLFGGSKNTVDVVAHSRGGLIARWWIESLERSFDRVENAVLLGSPLAGTSLAAPPALRRTLDLLTNTMRAVDAAGELIGTALPLAVVVSALAKLIGGVTNTLAKTPILDGAIAMIPGLAAQSRVGNNQEIRRLREGSIPVTKYAAVTSDFEPDEVGWHFWRYFTQKPLARMADVGADLVFPGANDLVVDHAAMADLGKTDSGPVVIDPDWVFDCGSGQPNSRVHHLNYFRQGDVIDFMQKALAW
jgi:hypothetical protein